MADEERKIEPYYQAKAKQLVDSLYDLGLLSESLSRDGITSIDDLVALYFQQIADASKNCASFSKKYKILGGRLQKNEDDDRERHEEEMRWIARAKEAEARVAELETQDIRSWSIEIGVFLKEFLRSFPNSEKAHKLFTQAVEAGFIPKPDCGPGEIILRDEGVAVKVDGEERNFFPGMFIKAP